MHSHVDFLLISCIHRRYSLYCSVKFYTTNKQPLIPPGGLPDTTMTVSIIKPNGETVVSFDVKTRKQGEKVGRAYINRHVLPSGTKANIQ